MDTPRENIRSRGSHEGGIPEEQKPTPFPDPSSGAEMAAGGALGGGGLQQKVGGGGGSGGGSGDGGRVGVGGSRVDLLLNGHNGHGHAPPLPPDVEEEQLGKGGGGGGGGGGGAEDEGDAISDSATPAKDTVIERLVAGRTPPPPSPPLPLLDTSGWRSEGEGRGGGGRGGEDEDDDDDDDGCEYETRPYSVAELSGGVIHRDRLRNTLDFTVLRKGYGEIKWPGITDLTEPDLLPELSQTVRICEKYVDVYPDEWVSTKTSSSSSSYHATTTTTTTLRKPLSKRAEVTLVVHKITSHNMEARLKKQCEKNGEMLFLRFQEQPVPQVRCPLPTYISTVMDLSFYFHLTVSRDGGRFFSIRNRTLTPTLNPLPRRFLQP